MKFKPSVIVYWALHGTAQCCSVSVWSSEPPCWHAVLEPSRLGSSTSNELTVRLWRLVMPHHRMCLGIRRRCDLSVLSICLSHVPTAKTVGAFQSISLYRAIVQRRVLQCGYAESKRNVFRRILNVLTDGAVRQLGLLGFKAKHSLLPPYLQDILSSHHPTRQLRSSSAHQFFKPAVNSNFASRACSVSVPSVWNSLKPNLRSIDSSASFKSQFKTTLFLSAYGST